MVVISVLYPKTADSQFDHAYYIEKHMPMVRARWGTMGLVSDTLVRGMGTLEGGVAPFELIGLLTFRSHEDVGPALAAHGAEVIGDIPNFTGVTPLIQVNEPAA